ncbi:MAG: S-formylglutathione hydrolase FrmB [Streptosporangiaceae bacterium]|jgi:S-formylglutathione hydrolase FrmB|nr:S-formylglutathione hydrolase FrmB [Streptosporangiaceae bacterium]
MERAIRHGIWFITVVVIMLLTFARAVPARAAAPAADDGARVMGESMVAPRTLDLTVGSPAIDGVQKVRLLLPRGWSKSAHRTWPVLWLLHGGADDYTAWTKNTDVADLARDSGVIVVMPNGGRCGDYTDWWNYGNGGSPQWETFHMTDLRQILERGYRAGKARAIAGNSMGGLGAIEYAARFPGMFRAAAVFSGYLDTLHGHVAGDSSPGIGPAMVCPFTDWRRVWGDPDAQAAIWHAHNPFDLVARLRGVELYVAAGNGTAGPLGGVPFTDPVERLAGEEAHDFVGLLDAERIAVTSHFYVGQHSWPYWQRELHAVFPLLMDRLG